MYLNINKSILVIIILTMVSAGILNAQGNYQLVWEDNFDGNTLNTKDHWTIEVMGDGGNAEYQWYQTQNIAVGKDAESGENCLIITIKKEKSNDREFTSGRLKSAGKVRFKYGKIEARIKLPKTANGLWPAFWMMGDDYAQVGWPKSGEIDILETGNAEGIKNGTQDRFFNGHFHWGESWNNGAYPNWGKEKTNDYSIQDGEFHLFSMIWDKNSIKMYLDMDKYPEREPYLEMSIAGKDEPGNVGRYFHKPYFILFNCAVGGHFTGITGSANYNKITALNAENNFEEKMYVDYVRVYQKGDEGEEYYGPKLKTGLIETLTTYFKIHPNPTTNRVVIEGNFVPKKISVFDPTGSKVMEVYNTMTIDMSSLPSANYVLQIEINDNEFETHKVIKMK